MYTYIKSLTAFSKVVLLTALLMQITLLRKGEIQIVSALYFFKIMMYLIMMYLILGKK